MILTLASFGALELLCGVGLAWHLPIVAICLSWWVRPIVKFLMSVVNTPNCWQFTSESSVTSGESNQGKSEIHPMYPVANNEAQFFAHQGPRCGPRWRINPNDLSREACLWCPVRRLCRSSPIQPSPRAKYTKGATPNFGQNIQNIKHPDFVSRDLKCPVIWQKLTKANEQQLPFLLVTSPVCWS